MNYKMQFREVWSNFDMLLWGAAYSLVLCCIAGFLGLAIGIAAAEARRTGPRWARVLVSVYVEAIRNTPFIVQLFFLFFGLSSSGLRLSPEVAAAIALTINIGAYFCEIIRAGLEATPPGQIEAARALGLRDWRIFRAIVLPPALSKAYPALTSQFVLVFLGSAVISQISAPDLTFQAQFLQSRTFRAFEIYFVVTAMYVAMALSFKLMFTRAERLLFPWKGVR